MGLFFLHLGSFDITFQMSNKVVVLVSAKHGSVLFNHIQKQFHDNGLSGDLEGVIHIHHVDSKTKVLFLNGTVITNSHGKEICKQEKHLSDLKHLLDQKEGITVSCDHRFVNRTSSRINVGGGLQIYWNDILDLKSGIELYVKREKHFVGKDFLSYFGGTGNKTQIDSVIPQMERMSDEARGDPLQMLEVQCSAYQVYYGILNNQIRELRRNLAAALEKKEMPNEATSTNDKKAVHNQFRVLLERELSGAGYNQFVDYVDDIFKNAIHGAGEKWLQLGDSIVSSKTTFQILGEMKAKLPLCYAFYIMLSISPSQKGRSRHRNMSQQKELMGLISFFCGVRQRNCKKLTWWALVNTIVHMGRGMSKISMQKSVNNRDSLSVGAFMSNKLPLIKSSMDNSAKNLLAKEKFVLVGYDNMQIVKSQKSQRDGKSSYSITGTVMYALCMDYIRPTFGEIELY